MQPITPIAENHIIITEKFFNEGMRAVENKNYKKEVKLLALILTVLYLIVAVWLIYTGGSLFFLLGETIFLAALLYWLFIMLPGTKRKNKYKSMSQGMDTAPVRVIHFYQDHMSISSNSGKTTDITYQEVIGWEETRNLYIINCTKNRCVLVSKEGVISGNFDIIESRFPNNN